VRIFVLGSDGQLGHELCGIFRAFAELCAATEHDFDMTDPDALHRAISSFSPDLIVNAAAYTDVDGAERNPDLADRINAKAVAQLGQIALERKVGLVHFSTDFVFDGSTSAPYRESDKCAPLNEYGKSKLKGELALIDLQAPAVTLRTAWVYSLRRKSFVSSILRFAREREEMQVVDDQVGNPTYCRDLATVVGLLVWDLRRSPYSRLNEAKGVYHLAGDGHCSRYELALAALEADPKQAEHKVRRVSPVPSSNYQLPAKRPLHAPLDCTLFRERFGLAMPPWKDGLMRALAG
jgi:dTDP-4-dehydrorhamnose reductase